MAAAALSDRHGTRDATLILVAYRHGWRVSELVSLRWEPCDVQQHGIASVHPLRGSELRTLRRLQRDYPETAYVFVSERKAPLTTDAIRKIVALAGRIQTDKKLKLLLHRVFVVCASLRVVQSTGSDRLVSRAYKLNDCLYAYYLFVASLRLRDHWRSFSTDLSIV